jgi:hypothetical protein
MKTYKEIASELLDALKISVNKHDLIPSDWSVIDTLELIAKAEKVLSE